MPCLDDRVLVGNLVAGGTWVLPVLFLAPLPALVAAAYVALASVLLAAAYGREHLTRRREAWTWVVTWAGAVAAWVVLLAVVALGESGDPESTGSWVGTALWMLPVSAVLGTLCYLAWQVTALAVRRVLAWTERRSESLSG